MTFQSLGFEAEDADGQGVRVSMPFGDPAPWVARIAVVPRGRTGGEFVSLTLEQATAVAAVLMRAVKDRLADTEEAQRFSDLQGVSPIDLAVRNFFGEDGRAS